MIRLNVGRSTHFFALSFMYILTVAVALLSEIYLYLTTHELLIPVSRRL